MLQPKKAQPAPEEPELKFLPLAEGRQLAFAEYGDPAGCPVVFCHGWPSSCTMGELTDADWNQARRELLGEVLPPPPEESEQAAKMQDEWEVTPDDRGHRVNRPGTSDDEESVGEQLVTDGVEEATHDQMLEARREELEQEGGIV